MDGGLMILGVVALLTVVILLPLTIWRISKSHDWGLIAGVHLLIIVLYVIFVLLSGESEGAVLPLPERPIKIGVCIIAHIWIAFFHSATIRARPNTPSLYSERGGTMVESTITSSPVSEQEKITEKENAAKTSTSRTIIILSTLICINPLWTIVGLPLYLLGIIILLKSSAERKYKIRWSVIPISCIIIFYLSAVAVYVIFQK
jgi:hypothetical protein